FPLLPAGMIGAVRTEPTTPAIPMTLGSGNGHDRHAPTTWAGRRRRSDGPPNASGCLRGPVEPLPPPPERVRSAQPADPPRAGVAVPGSHYDQVRNADNGTTVRAGPASEPPRRAAAADHHRGAGPDVCDPAAGAGSGYQWQ